MFRDTRHIHLVAIGGIGMSGIAEVLINLGFSVSGSDLNDSAITQRLAGMGARIHVGHDAAHVEGADVVVRSSAVTEANVEVAAARAGRIPVIRRAEMLAELMRLKYGIAVAGSHGKTTTTSLVAAVLAAGDLDPTVIAGGRVKAMGSNAVLGGGEYLVAEADESDGTFLHLSPTVAVVTNIDHEHVDFYPDLDALREAFGKFLAKVPFYGACVLCADDPVVRSMLPHLDRKVLTYGLGREADVWAEPLPVAPDQPGQEARVSALGRDLGVMKMTLLGRHNLLNALAAVAVGLELGLPADRRGPGRLRGRGASVRGIRRTRGSPGHRRLWPSPHRGGGDPGSGARIRPAGQRPLPTPSVFTDHHLRAGVRRRADIRRHRGPVARLRRGRGGPGGSGQQFDRRPPGRQGKAQRQLAGRDGQYPRMARRFRSRGRTGPDPGRG